MKEERITMKREKLMEDLRVLGIKLYLGTKLFNFEIFRTLLALGQISRYISEFTQKTNTKTYKINRFSLSPLISLSVLLILLVYTMLGFSPILRIKKCSCLHFIDYKSG